MTITNRPLTYEDLLTTPDDLNRYEILDGRMVVSPAPTTNHQVVVGRIFLLQTNAGHGTRLGMAYLAPLDIRLGPHDIVEEAYVTAAPDLVAEVLSPSSGRRDRTEKMALYAAHGVREY